MKVCMCVCVCVRVCTRAPVCVPFRRIGRLTEWSLCLALRDWGGRGDTVNESTLIKRLIEANIPGGRRTVCKGLKTAGRRETAEAASGNRNLDRRFLWGFWGL